jgi:hypothetical protein
VKGDEIVVVVASGGELNAMANKLSRHGFISRSPHLIFNMGRPFFPKSLPLLDPISSYSSSLSLGGSLLNPLLFSANTTGNLVGFLGIWD